MTRRAPPGQNSSVLFICISPLRAAFAGERARGVPASAKAPPVIKNSRRSIMDLEKCSSATNGSRRATIREEFRMQWLLESRHSGIRSFRSSRPYDYITFLARFYRVEAGGNSQNRIRRANWIERGPPIWKSGLNWPSALVGPSPVASIWVAQPKPGPGANVSRPGLPRSLGLAKFG